MLDGFCKNAHVEEALEFLQELQKKRLDLHCCTYAIVIGGLCRKGKLDIACDMFNTVFSKGLDLNVRFYFTMIESLCREGLLDEAKDMTRKMEQNGCPPDNFTNDVVLQGFLRKNNVHEVFPLLLEMVDKGFSPNAHTFVC
ncbi:unnamed protein product [Withania somnifera]